MRYFTEYLYIFQSIGETDIDKTDEMLKSSAAYQKPERISRM